ncbi:FBD-associated F-box protein At2g26860-like [Carex rostrata]
MEGRDLAWDRISALPDPLLTHILSFLIYRRGCAHIQDKLTKEEFQKHEDKFLRFFRGVILNRENLTLDTFKLTWWGDNVRDTLLHIYECLCCAVECRPRILSIDIDINTKTLPDLTNSIFTCTSIEEMSLWLHTAYVLYEDSFIKPGPINLPSLQKLELCYLDLNNEIMRMLISGCPVMEELVLINCLFERVMICSKVLKNLVFECCHHCGPMEISCPEVVSLSIKSINTEGITLKNMSSLATADISCAGVYFSLARINQQDLRLLGGLSNVTSLKLYSRCPHVLVFSILDFLFCQV